MFELFLLMALCRFFFSLYAHDHQAISKRSPRDGIQHFNIKTLTHTFNITSKKSRFFRLVFGFSVGRVHFLGGFKI